MNFLQLLNEKKILKSDLGIEEIDKVDNNNLNPEEFTASSDIVYRLFINISTPLIGLILFRLVIDEKKEILTKI